MISGATPPVFNGVFAVTVDPALPTKFTFTITGGTLPAGATGTIIASLSLARSEYDVAGNLTVSADAYNRKWRYAYDGLNRKVSETSPDADGLVGTNDVSIVTYVYDPAGNVTSAKDARGYVTQYAYDTLNRKVSETLPSAAGLTGAGPRTTYEYDAAGNAIATRDPIANADPALQDRYVDVAFQDDLNRTIASGRGKRPTTSISVVGGVVTVTISGAGHGLRVGERIALGQVDGNGVQKLLAVAVVTVVVDPNTFEFAKPDSLPAAVGASFLVRSVSTASYDMVGNAVASTDALGRTTTSEHDAWGRQVKQTAPDSTFTTTRYDLRGNVTATTDARNFTTTYAYDALSRKTTQTQPDPDGAGPLPAPVTTFGYDVAGNLEWTIDPAGNQAGPNNKTNLRATTFTYDAMGRQRSVTSPHASGDLLKDDAPTTGTVYDPMGNVVAVVDALGRATTYSYDAMNRKVKQTSPTADGDVNSWGAPVTTWAYDLAGNLVGVTTPLGNQPRYLPGGFTSEYLNSGYQDPSLYTTRYLYDALGRKTVEIAGGADHPVTRFLYDANGRTAGTIDPLGNATLGLNPTQSQIDDVVQRHLHASTLTYDEFGRKTAEQAPDPDSDFTTGDPVGVWGDPDHADYAKRPPLTTWRYDAVGNVLSVTSPKGNLPGANANLDASTAYTSFSEYDAMNRTVKETGVDPDGAGTQPASVTRYGYDANGNTIWVLDPLGNESIGANPSPQAIQGYVAVNRHATTYVYDALNRKTEEKQADPDNVRVSTQIPKTTWTYDVNGNQKTVTDAVNNSTTYTYDLLNRLSGDAITLETGTVTRTYSYDKNGNLTRKIDRNGRVTDYTYDHLNRNTTEVWREYGTGPALNTLTFLYDLEGKRTEATDDGGPVVVTAYDPHGRVIQSSTVAPTTPGYEYTAQYDLVGRRVNDYGATVNSYISSQVQTTTTYDALNRAASLRQTYTGSFTATMHAAAAFGYTHDGQLHDINRTQEYTAGQTVQVVDSTYLYDRAGRLSSLAHVDSFANTAGSYGYTYDVNGRISAVHGAAHAVENKTYAYDDNGQLTGTGGPFNEAYAYDANGNRHSAVSSAVDDIHQTGKDNRVTSDGTYTYDYDSEGNRIRRTEIATGLATEYVYDHRNRLVKVLSAAPVANGSTVMPAAGPTADPDGDGNGIVSYFGGGVALPAGRYVLRYVNGAMRYNHTYDWSVQDKRAGTGLGFTILAGGQVRGLAPGLYGDYPQKAQAEAANSLATPIEIPLTSDGTVGVYLRDWFGGSAFGDNVIEGTSPTYALYRVTDLVTYTYDADGRRVSKEVDADTDGEADLAGSEYYGYGPDGKLAVATDRGGDPRWIMQSPQGGDRPLAEVASDPSAGTTWLLPDHQGTVRDTVAVSTNGAGTVTTGPARHVAFDGFGNVNPADANQPLRFGYTGQEHDAETGLTYMNARYYDPRGGRFVNQDPTGFGGGDGNLYRYVGNNTPNFTDPTGTSKLSELFDDAGSGLSDMWKGFRDAVSHGTDVLWSSIRAPFRNDGFKKLWQDSLDLDSDIKRFEQGFMRTQGADRMAEDWNLTGGRLDIGWISVGRQYVGEGHYSYDASLFGAAVHSEWKDGESTFDFGAHYGLGVGPASVGVDYMNGVHTASVGVGPLSASVNYTEGTGGGVGYAVGLSLYTRTLAQGVSGSLGYGWNFDADGNAHGDGFNVGVNAREAFNRMGSGFVYDPQTNKQTYRPGWFGRINAAYDRFKPGFFRVGKVDGGTSYILGGERVPRPNPWSSLFDSPSLIVSDKENAMVSIFGQTLPYGLGSANLRDTSKMIRVEDSLKFTVKNGELIAMNGAKHIDLPVKIELDPKWEGKTVTLEGYAAPDESSRLMRIRLDGLDELITRQTPIGQIKAMAIEIFEQNSLVHGFRRTVQMYSTLNSFQMPSVAAHGFYGGNYQDRNFVEYIAGSVETAVGRNAYLNGLKAVYSRIGDATEYRPNASVGTNLRNFVGKIGATTASVWFLMYPNTNDVPGDSSLIPADIRRTIDRTIPDTMLRGRLKFIYEFMEINKGLYPGNRDTRDMFFDAINEAQDNIRLNSGLVPSTSPSE